MWGSHESMTCGVNGIYLNFGSFNGMHPIIPLIKHNIHQLPSLGISWPVE
jgi:hypothetical protein